MEETSVLEQLDSPELKVEESSDYYAMIVAEPLQPGFGVTVGNALRRVLLSSLPGAAVTSVRIDGVEHEFSHIDKVKEDTTEFLLNVKQIRLRALTDRPAKMHLEVQGSRVVTAADIEVPADYEIVNPELYLATLDGEEARLEVEFNVERGKGYIPAGSHNGLGVIGIIPVDSIFTPVRKVNYHVGKTRVGQETNLDRLVLEVWTDGTISGVDAIALSADVLVQEFQMFSRLGKPAIAMTDRGMGIGRALPPDKYNVPIEDLNLSVRAYNCLKRSGLSTVGQVLEKSEEELLALRNFGRKSYEELRDRLIELGYLDPSARQMSSLSTIGYDESDDEDLGSLGAALMEALKEAGETTDDIVRERDDDF
jgi:DNA-directed RNA polymerase subunit alpha